MTTAMPPDYGAELARILGKHSAERRRSPHGEAGLTLDLHTAMAELDAWLDDPRQWDQRHRRPWLDVISDLREAITTRGPRLRRVTPALDDLDSELNNLPGDGSAGVRIHSRVLNARARGQLGSPTAAVAAFDDLTSTVHSGSSTWRAVEIRLLALDAALLAADRSPDETDLLASVLRDSRRGIAIAERELDGTPIPDLRETYNVPAGVPFDLRLELSRRLMAQQTTPGHHVIWLTYGSARLMSSGGLDFGPVTFFDGPSLLRTLAGDPSGYSHDGIPPELHRPNDGSVRWPDGEAWVAARVDLGNEACPDPLRVARDQANALVKLASFSQSGTSWRELAEYVRYVDGDLLGSGAGFSFAPSARPEPTVDWDKTATHLIRLQSAVTKHMPIRDPRFHELIDAAGVVDSAAASTDPTAILQEVRIIELIASRCGAEWVPFLRNNYAIHWARDQIWSAIQQAIFQPVFDDILRGSDEFPELATIWSELTSGTSQSGIWEFDFNYPKALAAIADFAPRLPTHNVAARQLRSVAEQTRSPAAIDKWVDRLTQDYERLLARLLRCRNSLAHGGPINLAVAATVRPFSTRHAINTAAGAISAALDQRPLDQAFHTLRERMVKWRKSIATAATPHEALFGPQRPAR